MLPCWQLQELAEGVGDINTEAKLLLLIIASMCVREKEMLSGQKGEKEAGSQRGGRPVVPSRRLARPWGPRGPGSAGAVRAAPSGAAGERQGLCTQERLPVTCQLLGRTGL